MTTSRDAYDHLFKLLIIGDSGHYVTTVGVDFKVKTVSISGERVKLQIWDTAGQERFRTITSTFFAVASVSICSENLWATGKRRILPFIVFDLTTEETYVNVKRWLNEIDQNCDLVQKVLVGNKCDDTTNRAVLESDARQYAVRMNVPYFETSAKDNINVDQVFNCITQLVLEHKKSCASRSNGSNLQRCAQEHKSIRLKSSRKRRKKTVCC